MSEENVVVIAEDLEDDRLLAAFADLHERGYEDLTLRLRATTGKITAEIYIN
jgi:hypothetical protein